LPDRLCLLFLIVGGLLVVMSRRNICWPDLFRRSAWLWLFFLYIGVSVVWTDEPFVSLKRWIKSAGALVMALVLLTEQKPREALASVFRRCCYLLIPLSLVLIKYFPQYGRAYGRWDGVEMWTGVGTHRNGLGQLCALSILFLVVALYRKTSSDDVTPKSRRKADVGILALAVFLLAGPGAAAYSATSISVTVVGVGMFLGLQRLRRSAGFVAAHLHGVAIASVVGYELLAEPLTNVVTFLLNRNSDFTGRATDIWPVVLEAAARHPVFGAGYGGVWGLGGAISEMVGVEQAHNGYMDVYLQLGIVGIVLLTAFLLEFCSRVRHEFAMDANWGLFGVAFLAVTLMYNLTETNFFDVYPGTALVLLAMVFGHSGSVTTGDQVVLAEAHVSRAPLSPVAALRPRASGTGQRRNADGRAERRGHSSSVRRDRTLSPPQQRRSSAPTTTTAVADKRR
jgi:O-antigen ligase